MTPQQGSEIIRARREALGLSQVEAAGRAGIAPSSWHLIEVQKSRPRSLTARAMERVLGLRPGTLVDAFRSRHVAAAAGDAA